MYLPLLKAISPFGNSNKQTMLLGWLILLVVAVPFKVKAANDCTADFDYFQAPSGWLDIQFISLSTGPIGYYSWDFGDGFQSDEMNPVHAYQNPGTYLVCLTVSSPTKDCYDVKCLEITVPLPVNCYTPFSIDTTGNNPFQYLFTAYPPPEVDTLHWNFGDGYSASGLTVMHTYSDTGTYIVSLTAYNHHNPGGCYSFVTDTIHIGFEPCISAFMMQTQSYNPLRVHFIPICSGDINSYFWQFGDGKTSFEISPIHTYSDTGIYQVCLTIANTAWPQYCSDTSCALLQIKIDRCKASFSYEQNPIYPLRFSFSNLSTGLLNEFFWDFGDGDTSHAIDPIHSFPSPGNYEVKLRVGNYNFPDICSDSIVKTVSTGDISCSASFVWTTDSLQPVEVSFFSNITGSPDQVQWDFGDGTTSTELNPIHNFPDTGRYQVKLMVYNTAYPSFCNDTAHATLHLRINHQPRADFAFYHDSLALQPNLFRFKDLSKGLKITQWYWTFGDGGTSIEQNPVHAYAAAQPYQVCLKVYDKLPPHFTVTDKVCKTLQGRNYFNLGGSVYAGEFPINNPYPQNDTALVSLFRIKNGYLFIPVRSGRFSKLGYYWFSDVLEGEYLVKATLSQGSSHFQYYFPTWGINALTWQSADPITLNKSIFDADIHLLKKNLSGSGPGSASGRVVVLQETPVFQMVPASQVIVYLKSSSGLFLDYTYSDSLGQFGFDHLPLATYFLESEYPGLLCMADTARLTVSAPVKKDLLIKLYTPHSLGLPEPSSFNGLEMFPNPARNFLTIRWISHSAQTIQLTVFSMDGRIIMKEGMQAEVGENHFQINTSDLISGVYIIKISGMLQEPIFAKFIRE